MSDSGGGEYDYYDFKIVFGGDLAVGKTNLFTRITRDRFSEDYESTNGLEFEIRDMHFDGKKIIAEIWDIG